MAADEKLQRRAELSKAIDGELSLIRKQHGWRQVDVSQLRYLMPLVRQATGRADREALQTFLLDLFDPVAPGDERPPLKSRDPRDEGLMMRWLFGEPEEEFEIKNKDGTVSVHSPAGDDPVAERINYLARYRGASDNTIFRARNAKRPTGGVARERLYEILDDLVDRVLAIEANASAAEEQPGPIEPPVANVSVDEDSGSTPSQSARDSIGARRETASVQDSKDARRDATDKPQAFWPYLAAKNRAARGMKRGLAALLVIAIAMILIRAALDSDGRSDAVTGGAEEETKPVRSKALANGALVVSLRAVNKTLDEDWGEQIRADPGDEVVTELTIRNRLPYDTPALVGWLDDSGGRTESEYAGSPIAGPYSRLRVLLADPLGNEWGYTRDLVIRNWTNQVDRLDLPFPADVTRRDPAKGKTLTAPTIDARKLPPSLEGYASLAEHTSSGITGIDSIAIGPIRAGRSLVVRWPIKLELAHAYTFGTFPPVFGDPKDSANSYLSRGSARPGQRIRVAVLLDNLMNREAQATVWVRTRAARDGRVVRLTAYGRVYDRPTKIGTMTVSSATGTPITLEVVPGTTELRKLDPPTCKQGGNVKKSRMPDGIADGGVDIGPFGGFTPHSRCAGTEFNQKLYFEAVVRVQKRQ